MLPQPFLVRRMRRETPDTFTIEIEPANGDQPSRFAPGQFNMLYVFGCGEIAISICARPAMASRSCIPRASWERSLKRWPNSGPETCSGCGARLAAAGPSSKLPGVTWCWWLAASACAPLRGALSKLLRRRKRPAKVVLLYGVRTPEDILYRREFERWRNSGLQIYVTVDRATGSWLGHVGVGHHSHPARAV